MSGYRPDRAVRLLTALASIAYFAMLAGAVVVLVGAPIVKLVAADRPEWTWGLEVPADIRDAEATVLTGWGSGRLEVEDVRGTLRLPIGMLPWWLFAVLWTHVAIRSALLLTFLHHLRRIFQRARDGAPFDPPNASRLHTLGVLAIAIAVLDGFATLITSLSASTVQEGGGITTTVEWSIDGRVVLFALVLMGLGAVFRHGAELEAEQALVV